jgi:hypothetical protein
VTCESCDQTRRLKHFRPARRTLHAMSGPGSLVEGIDCTIERIKTCLAACANRIYPDAVHSEDEIRRITDAIPETPVNIGMGFGVRSERRSTSLWRAAEKRTAKEYSMRGHPNFYFETELTFLQWPTVAFWAFGLPIDLSVRQASSTRAGFRTPGIRLYGPKQSRLDEVSTGLTGRRPDRLPNRYSIPGRGFLNANCRSTFASARSLCN